MNEKLQQAIAAARSGQSKEAQLLLTQALKENPEETQAWFLLSNLVESKQKKLVYLSKVLALDPQHSKAQQMLVRLQGEKGAEEAGLAPPPPAISVDSTDYLTQEKEDTVPDWLADEEVVQWDQATVVPSPLNIEDSIEIEEAPDWLQEEVNETWLEEPTAPEEKTAVAPPAKIKPVASASPPIASPVDDKRQKQQVFLTRILIALITVAIFISGTLIYLIWKIL